MNHYLSFIIKRIITMCLLVLFVSVFVFFVLRLSGVAPISVLGGDKGITGEARAALENQYHLNEPLIVQYGIWVKGLLTGHMGLDYVNRQDVSVQVIPRIPITMGLVLMSMLIAVVIAIPCGIISAVYKNTPIDSVISIISLVFAATPGFLISIIIVFIVAKYMPGYAFVGNYTNMSEYFSRIALPSIALSFTPIAFMTRVSRSSMIEQLKSNYIMTAKAKGISSNKIIFGHAFHNAVLPVLTIGTMMVGTTIASAVLVETVFSLPGIGSLLITAIKQYNYPVAQVLLLLLLIIFLVISTIVDILYAVIDPRISL